jgi:hypothetical protein
MERLRRGGFLERLKQQTTQQSRGLPPLFDTTRRIYDFHPLLIVLGPDRALC